MSTGSIKLSNLSIFTALLDQSKKQGRIFQVLTVLFPFLTIYSHLSMSQTYKVTVEAKN